MRAAVVAEDRSLRVQEVDTPEPGERQVRLRVEACGICGSDLHARPSPAVPQGSIMGHEFAGVIDAVGPGVSGWRKGERAAVFPFPPSDEHDLDAAMNGWLGFGSFQGGFAEAVVVGQEMLWRLPEGLSPEHGALVEPLAVALHGLDVGEVAPGEPMAVIGAGPIGIMTSLALRARGAERVVVVEKNERRCERIARLGFEAVGLDGVHEAVIAHLGALPSVVLECAGNPAAPNLAVELVAASGRVVLLGVLEEPVQISQLLLMLKEAQIRASFAYRPANFDESIELIHARKVPVDELVTASEPLERAEEMFQALADPYTEHIKVLLRP